MNARGQTRVRWEWLLVHPLALCVMALLVGLLARYQLLMLQIALSQDGNDFGKFYYAALNWLGGASLYQPTIATQMRLGNEWKEFLNLNPPHFHLLILPFTRLSLSAAFAVWAAVNVLAGLVAGWIAVHELRLRYRLRYVFPTICGVLLLAPTAALSGTGQFTGLMLLPMVAAWQAARRARWTAAGLWLGLLISVKPFLGLFIPAFFVMRQWRALLGVCVAGLLSFCLGLSVFGMSEHRRWVQALGNVDWVWAGMNGSIRGVLARALETSPSFTPVVNMPHATIAPWLLSSLVIAALTLVAARRSADHAFAAVNLAALLVSPLGWVYYAWLASPACLALWNGKTPVFAWLGIAALSVPLFTILGWQPSSIATLTVGSSYAWGFLALWLAVLQTPASQPVLANAVTESTTA